MTNTDLEDIVSNPLARPWLRRRDARHELQFLKAQSDDAILAKAHAVRGFDFLERLYGFYIDRSHPDTLQLQFGNRSMFRPTIDQRSTAAELGPGLVYSLGPTGYFSTILFPAKSDLGRVNEDHLFLQIGMRSAIKLVEGMQRDLSVLVAYAHVSSIDMDSRFGDRCRIWMLRNMAARGEGGKFRNPPGWKKLWGLTEFVARAFVTASFLSLLKPIGFVILIGLLGWLGWDPLIALLRSLPS